MSHESEPSLAQPASPATHTHICTSLSGCLNLNLIQLKRMCKPVQDGHGHLPRRPDHVDERALDGKFQPRLGADVSCSKSNLPLLVISHAICRCLYFWSTIF